MEPIKICAKLTGRLLKTAYKLNITKFKLDEDMPQCRIYFNKFIESMEMIFSYYKENCELLLKNPKTGGGDIKDFV